MSVIIRELTVTYFSKGPCSPPSLTVCCSYNSTPSLFLFFVPGFFFLSTSSICLLFAPASRRYFRLPPFSLQTRPPCLAEPNPQTHFCSFLLCQGSTQSQPAPFAFRCHTPACLFLFFFLVRPRFATFVSVVMMDLSVRGLQHVQTLASVTRNDLHVIRDWK